MINESVSGRKARQPPSSTYDAQVFPRLRVPEYIELDWVIYSRPADHDLDLVVADQRDEFAERTPCKCVHSFARSDFASSLFIDPRVILFG